MVLLTLTLSKSMANSTNDSADSISEEEQPTEAEAKNTKKADIEELNRERLDEDVKRRPCQFSKTVQR